MTSNDIKYHMVQILGLKDLDENPLNTLPLN